MPKKKYDDDDGRVIASMDGLDFQGLGSFRNRFNKSDEDMYTTTNTSPYPREQMTKKEELWFILGAMKASLMIGLAYILGLGLIIGIIVFFG